MRPLELALFGLGMLLLSSFCLSTLFPYAVGKLESVAERRSDQLRGDFLFYSSRKLMAVFLLVGGMIGATMYSFFGSLWLAVVSGGVPALLSGVAANRYRQSRNRKVISQLPSFLDSLAGYIKAGHSLTEALLGSGPLLPPGIREEVAWLSRLTRLGMPLAQGLVEWERRLPFPEMTLVVRPLRIALNSGGNVVSLLERSRDVLRTRQRQRDKMKSMTAQARLQALVLTMLPPVFLVVLSRLEPGFWEATTGSRPGRLILLSAGIFQAIGWLLIRNILRVKS